ncbi:methyl-accepting chemotaxis sensory transducer [Natrialba hulunbeirensis JCM 10989]|uniref:Methyl-accepting chemotaxis sensory transducer n=1 Tax=Natrialba hulunbeirensis JCM 10989 TaxID=1227493 RepID=M0A1V1_9EURY|nr:globin-coupled sensor protein [Natrialba hulunbeirensis]ELY92584.1 methyl-accepting chemotaxis sensory transducer [Natrialba hulunbeirensis JCM 10989]
MQPEETFGNGGLNGTFDVDDLVDRIGLDDGELAWRKAFIGFDSADERRLADLEPLLRDNREAIADDFYDNVLQYDRTQAIVDRSPKGTDALKQTQQAYLVSLATGSYDQDFFANRARIGKLHELLDMPLHHYVGQYGVYYELLLSRLNERVQQQVVDAIIEWADEREAEADADDPGTGLSRVVSALGFGRHDVEPEAETEAQSGDTGDDRGGEHTDTTRTTLEESFETTVREAIDDGMLDVLSLLRLLNLDMQIAVDTYVDADAQRLEDEIERRAALAREVESDVQAPLADLHTAGETVAQRAESISDQTETQATHIASAARELDDVSDAADEIAHAADEARAESARTERFAADGVDAADEALDELGAIEDATDRVAADMDALADRIEAIDDLVDRLDDLTQRTSVLAANAKIESARATGDSGAGAATGNETGSETMGIIASEVRTFAQQTKADLADIARAAEAIREDAAAAVEATEETVERVDTGTDRVRRTIDSLEEIHESARTTTARMDEVAAAADQQVAGVESTAQTLADLSESADEVASSAASVAAASEEQTASLRTVRDSVDRLTGGIETGVDASHPSRSV